MFGNTTKCCDTIKHFRCEVSCTVLCLLFGKPLASSHNLLQLQSSHTSQNMPIKKATR